MVFLMEQEDDIEALDPAETLLVSVDNSIKMYSSDDICPAGSRPVIRTFIAPFARANREEDSRIAWATSIDQSGGNPIQ